MRKFLLLILLIPLYSFAQDYTTYKNGFDNGFKNGYCYGENYGCISPIPPIPPTDYNMNYQTGYNNGFNAGRNAKQSQNNSNNTGGAYGQLRPTQPISTPQYSYNDNPEYIQQAWAQYYENRRIKQENKEIAQNKVIDIYNSVNSNINELRAYALENNLMNPEIQNLIDGLKKKNSKLMEKYQSRYKKYYEYYTESLEIDKKINEIYLSLKNK